MKRLLLVAACFVLFAFLACGGGEEPSSEHSPPPAANTPVPRTNNAPVPTATSRPVPPTDTPVSVPHFTVNSEQVNVRAGPGTVFAIIGTVEQGDRFDIGGRNVDGDWLEFCCVNGSARLDLRTTPDRKPGDGLDSPGARHSIRPCAHQHALVVSQHNYTCLAIAAGARRQCA